jgi:hypothetical protein
MPRDKEGRAGKKLSLYFDHQGGLGSYNRFHMFTFSGKDRPVNSQKCSGPEALV